MKKTNKTRKLKSLRNCEHCKKRFIPDIRHPNQRFCSDRCSLVAYRINNREKRAEYNRQYQKKYRKKVSERSKRWRDANLEKRRAYERQYYQEHYQRDRKRRCRYCKKIFYAKYSHKRCCSYECSRKLHWEKNKKRIMKERAEWIKNNREKHNEYCRHSREKKRKPRKSMVKQCSICKKWFTDTTYNHSKKFCSISCRNQSHRHKWYAALKDWRSKNYEKFKAQWTRYNQKNRDGHKIRRKKLIERLGGVCYICGFGIKLHIHHKIPKSQGGTNDISNLALLCPNHHEMIHRGLISAKSLKI